MSAVLTRLFASQVAREASALQLPVISVNTDRSADAMTKRIAAALGLDNRAGR